MLFSCLFSSWLTAGTRYFPQIADGTQEGFSFSTGIELVNAGSEAEIHIRCFDGNGVPLQLDWSGADFENPADGSLVLERGEILTLSTPGQGPLKAGYAVLEAPERVFGTVVFRGMQALDGKVLFEAGVPAVYPQREMSILVDSMGHQDSGIALVAGGTEAGADPAAKADLKLLLRGASGELLGEERLELDAGKKLAKFVTELFSEDELLRLLVEEMRGSLSIVSDGLPLAAVTLRQNRLVQSGGTSSPLLTAFPVSPSAVQSESVEKERVLVFAPHPDDEALGCAGVLKRAKGRGDAVRVVLATCGDAYASAKQKFEQQYPDYATDKDGDGDFDLLDFGVIRCGESMDAMKSLGLDESEVRFLGYPDAGLDDLWRSEEQFESPFTEAAKVPHSYDFAYRVGAPYQRQSILQDIREIIREFGPTTIYSTTVTDHHQDHWALAKFVKQALLELSPIRTWERHYGYLIHWEANQEGWPFEGTAWRDPSGHPPPDHTVDLSDFGYSADRKRSVINRYPSQLLGSPAYLRAFAKDTEIFWLEGWGSEK